VDVRVRAAQALLVLAKSAAAKPQASQVVFPATEKNPRYTEGSIVELNNGDLLCAVTEFLDSGSDFAKAHIVAKRSTDAGATWSESRVLQETTGKLNVMSVTMRRLNAPRHDTIAMFYLQKDDFNDLRVYVRFSKDECQSFGERVLVTDAPGYHVMNNDRVTQLRSGRLIVPVASTPNVKTVNHFTSRCWLSDDGGQTWRQGKGALDQPKRGAMEPEVIELRNGKLLMIARTQLGYVASCYSKDGGDTWSEGRPLGDLKGPEAPATIRRIPSTGDLLLIWNNVFVEGAGHGGRRTPLSGAISQDDGATWQFTRNLETDKTHTYSYPSILFSQGNVHLTYWDESNGRYSTRYRTLPVGWFYSVDK
jgi:sialidase-1